MIIFTIITTLVAYSLLSILIMVLFDFDDGIAQVLSGGILAVIAAIFWQGKVRKDRYFRIKHNKSTILDKETGQIYWCNFTDSSDIYLHHARYKLVEEYVSKEIWSKYPEFDRDLIVKLRRNCDHCKQYEWDNDCVLCKTDDFENFVIK